MRVDPRAIQLFLVVCREGTISGAARAEHMSQPSVSVTISQLERALGVKLFDRSRHGIILTPAGEALQRRAQAMENLLINARSEVQLIGLNIAGPLTIGGTPGALATLIPRVVASLEKEFPKFEMRILERADAVIHELLRSYHLDLAISTAGVYECPEDLRELVLLTDPFSLLVGPANSHLPDEISLSELSDARWVLPDAIGGFRRQIDALFIGSQTSVPAHVIRSDSLLTTKAIVRNTEFVTILPNEVATVEISTGVLRALRIREAGFRRQVGIRWLAERKPSPLARTFMEHAKRCRNI